jgi:hypothetical protein
MRQVFGAGLMVLAMGQAALGDMAQELRCLEVEWARFVETFELARDVEQRNFEAWPKHVEEVRKNYPEMGPGPTCWRDWRFALRRGGNIPERQIMGCSVQGWSEPIVLEYQRRLPPYSTLKHPFWEEYVTRGPGPNLTLVTRKSDFVWQTDWGLSATRGWIEPDGDENALGNDVMEVGDSLRSFLSQFEQEKTDRKAIQSAFEGMQKISQESLSLLARGPIDREIDKFTLFETETPAFYYGQGFSSAYLLDSWDEEIQPRQNNAQQGRIEGVLEIINFYQPQEGARLDGDVIDNCKADKTFPCPRFSATDLSPIFPPGLGRVPRLLSGPRRPSFPV